MSELVKGRQKLCAVWKGKNLLVYQSLHLFQDSLLILHSMPAHLHHSSFSYLLLWYWSCSLSLFQHLTFQFFTSTHLLPFSLHNEEPSDQLANLGYTRGALCVCESNALQKWVRNIQTNIRNKTSQAAGGKGGSDLKLEKSEEKQNGWLRSSSHISWRKVVILPLFKLAWWTWKYFGHSNSWSPL